MGLVGDTNIKLYFYEINEINRLVDIHNDETKWTSANSLYFRFLMDMNGICDEKFCKFFKIPDEE